MPFDPSKVDQFDVNRSVPTLNMVIGDVSRGLQMQSMAEAIGVFKKFLDKVRTENVKGVRDAADKSIEF